MRPVALDLDGVLWRAERAVEGSAEAVGRLRAAGATVVFVTNNAGPTVGEHEAKLARFGIDGRGAVLTSPMAAARLLRPGEAVLVAGGPGIAEAVVSAGAEPVGYEEVDRGRRVDVVVAGFHREFDWDRLRVASTAVRDGARFVATNPDPTYPTEDGLVPGAGAIVAAIATAAGVAPTIAGKPHEPMASLLVERCGPDGVVVGDRDDTDGALARACGWRFALVLSGVTTPLEADRLDHRPDRVAPDLARVVESLLADGEGTQ